MLPILRINIGFHVEIILGVLYRIHVFLAYPISIHIYLHVYIACKSYDCRRL